MTGMNLLNQFWQPVLYNSPIEQDVLICVGQLPPQSGIGQNVMPVGDAFAIVDFARLLSSKRKRFRISTADSVTLNDLQASTVLLVGTANNPWISYLTEGLRFQFLVQAGSNSKETIWIEDRKNPSSRNWSPAPSSSGSGAAQHDAIVARVIDPKINRWRMIAAGLDGIGTSTAARIMVEANYFSVLAGQLPAQWTSKNNVEAVISVPMVNGEAGVPEVVAYEVW
jgi:hypothetical protein